MSMFIFVFSSFIFILSSSFAPAAGEAMCHQQYAA